MFTLHWIAFAPARRPYRIGHLFTHNKGDFGAISVIEPTKLPRVISKLESQIWDKCSHYTG